jgi:drug/metabolite transporter (DMT)-like permease
VTTLLSMLLFRERVGAAKMAAILIGFIGVLVILRPGMMPFDMASGAVIMSAIMFSCSNIFSRFIGRREQTALSWGLITEIPILVVSAIFFSLHSVVPGALDLALIFIISAFSVGALLLLPRAFIYAPPSVAAPFQYIQMLWAILFGYTLFGDRLDLATGIGAAIIIASGIWLLKQDEKPEIQGA